MGLLKLPGLLHLPPSWRHLLEIRVARVVVGLARLRPALVVLSACVPHIALVCVLRLRVALVGVLLRVLHDVRHPVAVL